MADIVWLSGYAGAGDPMEAVLKVAEVLPVVELLAVGGANV